MSITLKKVKSNTIIILFLFSHFLILYAVYFFIYLLLLFSCDLLLCIGNTSVNICPANEAPLNLDF